MKMLKSIYNFFEFLSKARAAGILARCGDIKGAQKLMNA